MSNEVSIQVSIETKLLSEINDKCDFWSMLESPSTSDYDDMDNNVYKSTVLEPTIKHLIKETSLCSQASHNLIRRG